MRGQTSLRRQNSDLRQLVTIHGHQRFLWSLPLDLGTREGLPQGSGCLVHQGQRGCQEHNLLITKERCSDLQLRQGRLPRAGRKADNRRHSPFEVPRIDRSSMVPPEIGSALSHRPHGPPPAIAVDANGRGQVGQGTRRQVLGDRREQRSRVQGAGEQTRRNGFRCCEQIVEWVHTESLHLLKEGSRGHGVGAGISRRPPAQYQLGHSPDAMDQHIVQRLHTLVGTSSLQENITRRRVGV